MLKLPDLIEFDEKEMLAGKKAGTNGGALTKPMINIDKSY